MYVPDVSGLYVFLRVAAGLTLPDSTPLRGVESGRQDARAQCAWPSIFCFPLFAGGGKACAMSPGYIYTCIYIYVYIYIYIFI